MSAKEKKPKRGLLDGYKTYDPKAEGYGSPHEWKGAFRERMGMDAAKAAVGDDSPHGILGLDKDATWDVVKKAYRQMAMKHHPDKGGKAEDFRKIQGAYEILEWTHSRNK